MKDLICKIGYVLYAIVFSWWTAVYIGPIGIPWCFIIFAILHLTPIIFPSNFKMDLPEDIEIDYDILGLAGLNQTDSGFTLYCTEDFFMMVSFFSVWFTIMAINVINYIKKKIKEEYDV